MRFTGIRVRMLAAALVPVTLVVLALVAAFWTGRIADLDASHNLRARLLARQVALACGYGILSHDLAALQAIAEGGQRDPNIESVAVFDAQGHLLASAGSLRYSDLNEARSAAYANRQLSHSVDVFVDTVTLGNVPSDDWFSLSGGLQGLASDVSGFVVLEVSRVGLLARERDLLALALGVGLAGLVLGGYLAARMGDAVVRPVLQVSSMIERIGEGDFSLSSELPPSDPFFGLQTRLNQMAQRLAWGREEMEFRVESATCELRVKKEEAETATLAKSRFIAAASHDLRQPTHALGMFVSRLGQLPLEGQARALVASLESSVQSMQELLDGLLDVSRLDAGAVQVHKSSLHIGELLQSLRKGLQPLAEVKGLRLRIRPSPYWVVSDPLLLQRILMNLASNAIRYTEHGTVLIACRYVDNGRTVRLDVSDSGIGISPADQDNIFREFYQVGNVDRERTQGLGLGLNIVQRTAQLLGHRIGVRSALGCGSRFSIHLPAAPVPALPVNAAPAEVQALESGHGLRVLLMDADALALQTIADLLVTWGYAVDAVANIGQAMDVVAKSAPPDVVLTDFRIGAPHHGLDLVVMVRARAGRDLPACLMSADTDVSVLRAAKDAGLPLLYKPVNPAKLRSFLRRAAVVSEPPADSAG